jgi:hypothetical protein
MTVELVKGDGSGSTYDQGKKSDKLVSVGPSPIGEPAVTVEPTADPKR